MVQVGQINVRSFAKASLFLFYLLGLVLTIGTLIFSALADDQQFNFLSIVAMVAFGPVVYSILATIPLCFICVAYNWYARRWGGIHIELYKEVQTHLEVDDKP